MEILLNDKCVDTYKIVNVPNVRYPHILAVGQLFLIDLYMARMFVKLIISQITILKKL